MWEYFRHLFLPHHTNNFRAKLLHLDFFALYVVLIFVMSVSFRTIHKLNPDILGFATDIHTEQLLNFTNQKRTENGLGGLQLNDKLSQAAAGKARDMFSKGYWAHTAPDGMTPWDFINGAGYTYSVAGENLAKNFSNSQGVVDAWMNSPSHRENILRDQYLDVGFAIVNGTLNGEETTLVVQMFGKQIGTVAQAQVETVPSLIVPQTAPAEAQEIATNPGELAQAPANESPIVSIENELPPIVRDTVISPIAGAVTRRPLFDIATLAKQLSLGLSTLLMIILVIDGLYVWRHKIVRIGGRTVAHLLFLFTISGIIWFMSFGSIL